MGRIFGHNINVSPQVAFAAFRLKAVVLLLFIQCLLLLPLLVKVEC